MAKTAEKLASGHSGARGLKHIAATRVSISATALWRHLCGCFLFGGGSKYPASALARLRRWRYDAGGLFHLGASRKIWHRHQ